MICRQCAGRRRVRTHGVKVAGAGKGAAEARYLAAGLVYRDDVPRCHLSNTKQGFLVRLCSVAAGGEGVGHDCAGKDIRHPALPPLAFTPCCNQGVAVSQTAPTFSFVSASIIFVPRS